MCLIVDDAIHSVVNILRRAFQLKITKYAKSFLMICQRNKPGPGLNILNLVENLSDKNDWLKFSSLKHGGKKLCKQKLLWWLHSIESATLSPQRHSAHKTLYPTYLKGYEAT